MRLRPAMLLAPGGPGRRLASIGYRRFFGLRSSYAGSSVASGRIEFVSQPSSAALLRTIRSLPVALHGASLARSYFQLLAGSSAREGLSPSHSSALPSAHMAVLRSLGVRSTVLVDRFENVAL